MQRIYHASEVHRDVILRTLCCYFLRGLSRLYHCHRVAWTKFLLERYGFDIFFSKNGICLNKKLKGGLL